MGNRLAQARAERGWTKSQLIRELRAAAKRRKMKPLVGDESLARRIAVWENRDGAISGYYRDLICDAYSLSPVELGLVELPAGPTPERIELVERLTLSRLDGGLVELLRGHTQSIRMMDRRLGGATIYQQTAAHVEQIDKLVRYALPGAHREAAADELGQAAALAGWQALDMGRLEEAWRLHEVATAASRESGHPAGLAYARAQQAFVLLDADRSADAHEIIRRAREEGRRARRADRRRTAGVGARCVRAAAGCGRRAGGVAGQDRRRRRLPRTPRPRQRRRTARPGT